MEKSPNSDKQVNPTVIITHNGEQLEIRGNVVDETVLYWMLGKAMTAVINGGPKEKIVKTIPELMGKTN